MPFIEGGGRHAGMFYYYCAMLNCFRQTQTQDYDSIAAFVNCAIYSQIRQR